MTTLKNAALLLLLCAVSLGLVLSGCGSSGSPTTTNQDQSASQVYGVASLETTSPGTVSVKDSSVPAQERTTAISSNGSFTVDVSGLNSPYVLRASSTDDSGAIQMYSVSMTGGRTNINPITDLAVAGAANGTNPDDLYRMSDRDMYRRTADDFESIISKLRTVLAPLFALYQVSKSPVDDDEQDDNNGLRALLHDVRFIVSNGRVLVKNRATGAIIFTGSLNDLNSGTFYPGNMPPGPGGSGGSTTCNSFTYSAWGACQSDNTQSRTVATSSPTGCTGGSPVLSQSCVYVPPVNTCTSFTYSAWGACQADNTQSRTVATSSPTGCTGGSPVLSQACIYVPPVLTCTSFTYNAWGACQPNNTQTRTVATQSPTGCTGGSPVLSQACTYVPPVLDGAALYTGNCSGCHGALATSSKLGRTASQIQTAITNNTGGMGSLSGLTSAQIQAIATALAPATCTSFTYNVWGACQANNTQTRTVATQSPAGCTGGSPVLSQSCVYVPPVLTCTSFTYNAWGACQPSNTQTRTVATQSPTGCTGGSPVLSQSCTYTPPSNPVTLAVVQSTCTQCHGLTVNTTVFKSGGYSVSGRTASAWVSALTGMLTPPTGTTIQNFADFLVTVP